MSYSHAYPPAGVGTMAAAEPANVVQRSIAKMEAFVGTIPPAMKKDYVEALTLCPELFTGESHPVKFLRRERFDSSSASFKLVLYWKMRKDLFGNRAFLPLTLLDGNGALDTFDLKVLRTGFVANLSESFFGQLVVSDSSRLGKVTVPDLAASCLRCAFYISQAAAADVACQKNGFTLLHVWSKRDNPKMSSFRDSFQQLVKALPVGVRKVIVVQGLDWAGEGEFMAQALPHAVNLVNGVVSGVPDLIACSTRYELSLKLQNYGFPATSIPESLGGKWSYDSFYAALKSAGLRDEAGSPESLRRQSVPAGIPASAMLELAAPSPLQLLPQHAGNKTIPSQAQKRPSLPVAGPAGHPLQHGSSIPLPPSGPAVVPHPSAALACPLAQGFVSQAAPGFISGTVPALNGGQAFVSQAGPLPAPMGGPGFIPRVGPLPAPDGRRGFAPKGRRESLKAQKQKPASSRPRPSVPSPSDRAASVPAPAATDDRERASSGEDGSLPTDGHRFVETPEVVAKGLVELENAISLLPDEDKAALLEARRLIPDISEKEAPPIRFLRVESYNTWAAAKRLANYWRTRKELFGDRAFLPMNQSGEGALSREDVTVLRSGYYLLLPTDEEGRPVICGHPTRRSNHSPGPRLRLAFYMFSVICEQEKTQRDGCVVLTILQRPKLDGTVREATNALLASLPLRVHRVHIMNIPLETDRRTYVESMVPICLKLFGVFVQKRATVHVADTEEELHEKLAKHGITRDSLPEDVGGKFTYDKFNAWLELRLCAEWELPVMGARSYYNFACIPDYKARTKSSLTEEEQLERKRKLNVVHSRRKRARSKVEREVLLDQVSNLRSDKLRLEVQQMQLEKRLKRAKEIVADFAKGQVGEDGDIGKTPMVDDESGANVGEDDIVEVVAEFAKEQVDGGCIDDEKAPSTDPGSGENAPEKDIVEIVADFAKEQLVDTSIGDKTPSISSEGDENARGKDSARDEKGLPSSNAVPLSGSDSSSASASSTSS